MRRLTAIISTTRALATCAVTTCICTTTLVVLPAITASAQEYSEVTVTHPASLRGRVILNGTAPAPLQLLITKDVEVCGEGYRKRVEVDVDENNDLRNVVVYIEDISAGKSWGSLIENDAVDQKGCRFNPHVQVIRRNAEVQIINSDSTLHNIHAYELIGRARRSLFNISQPKMGTVPQVLRPQRGNHVSLECDSHDFMQGWIYVTDHPYATVVGDTGQFKLSEIPPGKYRVSAWHPRLGILSKEVVISDDAMQELNFEFKIESKVE